MLRKGGEAMSKTKRRLRAEAAGRLKALKMPDKYLLDVVLDDEADEMSYADAKSALVELLTDDEPPEGIDQDWVRGLIERHSTESLGCRRQFDNGAYARIANEIADMVERDYVRRDACEKALACPDCDCCGWRAERDELKGKGEGKPSYGIRFAETFERPAELMTGETLYDHNGETVGWVVPGSEPRSNNLTWLYNHDEAFAAGVDYACKYVSGFGIECDNEREWLMSEHGAEVVLSAGKYDLEPESGRVSHTDGDSIQPCASESAESDPRARLSLADDAQDTRDKLEADVQAHFWHNDWCRKEMVLEWLDRQSAITEREMRDRYQGECLAMMRKRDEWKAKAEANANNGLEREGCEVRA